MQIIDVGVYTVEVRDSKNYHSTVTRQHGKWYCLRCSRYHCEHAFFVGTNNPTLVEIPLSEEEVTSIIDTD